MILVALQLMERVTRTALLRRHVFHAVKVRGASEQGLQFEQPLPLLVLFLFKVLQLAAQVRDVRAKVRDRL